MSTILWWLWDSKTLIGLLSNVLSSLHAFGIGVWWFGPWMGGRSEKRTELKKVRIAKSSIVEGGVM